MKYKELVKRIAISSLLSITPLQHTHAAEQPPTIDETSQDWGDLEARTRLLTVVPKWPAAAVRPVFEEYKHPERYSLPAFINGTPVNYNALFINTFWGPKENPFVKLPRPAKVFIMIKNNDGTKRYFMAPIVQDDNDKNYYVFDRSEPQPIPLKLWVYNKTDGYPCAVRFNVCAGYGVIPHDTCEGKGIESEVYRAPQFLHQPKEARTDFPPASRTPHQDWREKANALQPRGLTSQQTVMSGAIPWSDLSKRQELLLLTTTWPNYKVIKTNFEKIRDLRYFQDESTPGFMRRLSWLYPDDGCWTRTAAIIKDFFGPQKNLVNMFQRPSKVFAFGNLCLNTPNTPSGKISWWYHFAPIIRDAETNQTFVLDPAVEPKGPIPVEKWMELISSTTGACAQGTNSIATFNVCSGYGTTPFDNCDVSTATDFESEIRAELFDKYYRKFERNRQVELGRDPNKVLGDNPPWL